MTREQREALEQRICNFYYDSTHKSVKTTVKKRNIPQSTIYYVLKKDLEPRVCHKVVVHSNYPRRT